jgi:hypothetical protein
VISNDMIYVTDLMKLSPVVQELLREDTHSHTHGRDDVISISLFTK